MEETHIYIIMSQDREADDKDQAQPSTSGAGKQQQQENQVQAIFFPQQQQENQVESIFFPQQQQENQVEPIFFPQQQQENQVEPILYPKTIVPTQRSERVVVTDEQIERGVKFGPFPGTDAVEKETADWMQYVTTVESLRESNLLICFVKEQMYFYCHRLIYVGTELVVWGGSKRMHFHDPKSWDLRGVNGDNLTFMCQECQKHFTNETGLYIHWHGAHRKPEETLPDKNCLCLYCGQIIGSKNHYRVHILQHGINLSEETLYQKLKKRKGRRGRKPSGTKPSTVTN